MTYLELVNAVLLRLREDPVVSVNSTDYAKLIAAFVNDAKDIVEKSWDWTHLREIVTIPTVASTKEYTWTGKGNPVEFITAWNNTSNSELYYTGQGRFDKRNYTQAAQSGTPEEFVLRSIDANGDYVIEVYPTPDAVYSLVFNAKVEQVDLVDNADSVIIPTVPVLHLALAFAARERGETGGTSTQEYFSIADQYLSDAIAADAAMHENELTMNAGYFWPNNTMRA